MDYRPASPELETGRLHLRWLTLEDAPLMLNIWNDPEFIRHVGDRGIRNRAQAEQAMRDVILKVYETQAMGPYRISRHGSDEPMGICGLFQRENLEHPDIGYALLPGFRGCGYALEAAREICRHAGLHMGLRKLLAIVTPRHRRSVQLLEKLGMTAGERIRMPGDDDDVVVYRINLEKIT